MAAGSGAAHSVLCHPKPLAHLNLCVVHPSKWPARYRAESKSETKVTYNPIGVYTLFSFCFFRGGVAHLDSSYDN